MKVNDQRKLKAWAMKPIMGGPIRNPIKPILETVANATEGANFFEFPAALYTTGITEETPKPTSIKPRMANNR